MSRPRNPGHADLARRLALLPDGALGHADHPDVLGLAIECELAGYGIGQLYLIAARHAWTAVSESNALRFGAIANTVHEAIVADACEAPDVPDAIRQMASVDWRRRATVHRGGGYQGGGGEGLRRARAL